MRDGTSKFVKILYFSVFTFTFFSFEFFFSFDFTVYLEI